MTGQKAHHDRWQAGGLHDTRQAEGLHMTHDSHPRDLCQGLVRGALGGHDLDTRAVGGVVGL